MRPSNLRVIDSFKASPPFWLPILSAQKERQVSPEKASLGRSAYGDAGSGGMCVVVCNVTK